MVTVKLTWVVQPVVFLTSFRYIFIPFTFQFYIFFHEFHVKNNSYCTVFDNSKILHDVYINRLSTQIYSYPFKYTATNIQDIFL